MLVVTFKSAQYTGFESSGFVEVVIVLSGSSTTPISVMATTSEAMRQPATGKEYYINN